MGTPGTSSPPVGMPFLASLNFPAAVKEAQHSEAGEKEQPGAGLGNHHQRNIVSASETIGGIIGLVSDFKGLRTQGEELSLAKVGGRSV